MKNKKKVSLFVLLLFVIALGSLALRITLTSPTALQAKQAPEKYELNAYFAVPTPSFFQKELEIVAIGDSLTKGVGDHLKRGGYLYYVEQALRNEEIYSDINVINLGVTGLRSDELLVRLDEEPYTDELPKADHIYITIGGNDLVRIFSDNLTSLTLAPFLLEKDTFGERIQEIVEKTRALNPEAHIFLIGLYNPFSKSFSDIEEMNTIVSKWDEENQFVAQQFQNVTFIPIRDLFLDSEDNLLSADYFHPNTLGYKKMASRIYDYIQQELSANHIDRLPTGGLDTDGQHAN
ncbi:hypothetical protein G4V62_04555 [Bacillaceae bacterium SIJ1]|uniref:GDSL-type esterase/lipase family protein n=1 Tax=Litoribacterium kuwaitense TaxID=1398745 RepID=UPI0013EA96FE|nr:GDSL-type esterase/lipase family protein [Litoribacterium kuwaitense]NGP44257.1 hypothetical protein [Litoribacterium kuwaitense]